MESKRAKKVIIQSDVLLRPKDSSVVTAVLINNAITPRRSTIPYKMQYLQADVSQPKMHNIQTGLLLPRTQYLKSGTNITSSLSTKSTGISTKSAKNKSPRRKKQFLKTVSSIPAVLPHDIFDSDLSTCSFDTHDPEELTTRRDLQPVNGAKHITNVNYNVEKTTDNLPTLLISSSNVDCIAASQYSDSQCPQGVQYLQSQISQNENNNQAIEASTCHDQYLKPNSDVNSTLDTSNLVYAANTRITGTLNEEQFQKTEYNTATVATVLPSNVFDSNIFTCTFDDIMDSVPQEETYVPIAETATPRDAYIKSTGEFTPLTNVIAEEPVKIECSTSQYTTQCLQAEVLQENTYVLTTETATSGSTHYMNPDVFTSTLNSVTAEQSVKIESSTPEYTTQCLQAEVPQEKSYVLTTGTATPGSTHYMNSGVFTSTLNSVTADQSVKIESSTPEYTTQCLQAAGPQERTYVLSTGTATPGSTHYMNSGVFTSTLNSVTAEQSVKIESSTSEYTTQCLQTQAPKEETYVLSTETSTSGAMRYMDPDIFTSTLNTLNNQPIKIECSTPQYTTQYLEENVPQEENYVLTTETSTSESAQFVYPDVFTSTLSSIITDQPMNIDYSSTQYTTQSLPPQVPQKETYILTTEKSTFESSNNSDQSTNNTAFAAPLPPPKRNKNKKLTAAVKSEYSASQYPTQCLQAQISQEKTYLTTEKSNPGSSQCEKPETCTSTTDAIACEKPIKVECDRAPQKRVPRWKSPGVSDDIAQITIKKAEFVTPLAPVIVKKKKPPTIINSGLKFEFHRSARGKKSMILNGLRYRMVSAGEDKLRWRCSTHERFGCRAVVHTLDKHIIYMTDNHITSKKKKTVNKNPKV